MSLEAIEKVTEAERKNDERRAAAQAEAKQIAAAAERSGLARVQQAREAAAARNKELLRQAEERAAEQTARIEQEARAAGEALRAEAGKHLDEAAEFIVGRVVKQ